ncbi:MAG: hypothetical protein CMP24_06760 [Rickettsiales bacterium]|nr:hypothetical protein [Rickettsiales bacterium]
MRKREIERISCDVVVIGSGGTGSQAVQAAAEEGLSVIVISKDPMSSSDTKICEGVITVRQAGDSSDSEQILSDNIKLAGGDLPDKKITDAFAKDSKEAYDRLRNNGLRPSINFDKNKPKTLAIAMGGHNKSRSVGHKNSGLAFGHTNWDTIIKYSNVKYFEDCWFLELIKKDKKQSKETKIIGGIAYDAARGKFLEIRSKTTIIASGGLSTLFFPKTDTMRGNTGDSYALGLKVGAALLDMEQIQFLPFCLASPPSYEGLLAGEPATASFLGVIRDKNKKIILDSVYLRTRAECSEAIMRAVEEGKGSPNGGAYLDMTANKNAPKSGKYFMEYLKSALPSAYNNARQALGKEAGKAEKPWEVRPSAHYMMGGIKVDENGKVYGAEKENGLKQIEGLYAAGQAMGGLFGANRLGSTSLTELAVFGYRAGKAAVEYSKKNTLEEDTKLFSKTINYYLDLFNAQGTKKAYKYKLQLQDKSWKHIGPARTLKKLKKFLNYLDKLEKNILKVFIPKSTIWNQQFIDLIELKNMIESARAVALASIERDKSVGGHVRLDCKKSNIFAKPFSTQTFYHNGSLVVKRIKRERTELKRLIKYKLDEKYRLLKAKIIRYLPLKYRDSILEKKYKHILGSRIVSKLQPGSIEAAPGERKENNTWSGNAR